MPHPDHGEAGSSWRDIKVYQDHAFIVSEEAGHGMQVFDLRRLRDVSEAPEDFSEDAHYGGFGNAHNLELNMATGMAYAVGTRTFNGGPHFVDVSDPQNPVAAGGFGGDGYTHDAQCVIYAGPDEAWQGSEICFNSNENSLTIVDVSDHEVPNQISRTGYPRIGYTHQGWLSEDHRWFYMNDELDARNDNTRTRTLVWDVADLNAPQLVDQYYSPAISIAHNNYVRGDYLYMSNYTSGLRILDISTPDRPIEYAYLDSHPGRHEHVFEGSWSNYPWFESGTVVFTDISGGLFIVRPQLPDSDAGEADLQLTAETESPLQVLSNPWQRGGHVRLQVENHGPQVAVGTELLASLPVAGEIGLPDSVQEECDLEERVLRCRLGDLAVGESVVMDIAVREGNAVDDGLMMSVSSDVADPDTGNNRVTLSLPSASGFLSGSGGSGCSLGQWDPMLVLLMALSLLGLGRRRIRPVGSRSARV
jgi:choice-of-anchor B domain-containing protein